MLSVELSVGRDLNHELAAFRRPTAPAELLGGPSWSALEPSDGRDCKFGSIRWPRLQKLWRLQLTTTHSVINWHELTGSEVRRWSRGASDCYLCRERLAIAIKHLSANGRQ